MDKINFANPHTPYKELQLARWYTLSCALILLMLIGMCSIYVMQWRTYQHAIHIQKSYAAQQSLAQEHAQLQMQHAARKQHSTTQKITHQQLAALNESLGQDISLHECFITRDGNHTLTLMAPSRQRAQVCITLLNKKQLFGALSIVSLKTVKNGSKISFLVVIKSSPSDNTQNN